MGAMLLFVLLIRYWETYYEAILTFTTVLAIIPELDNVLVLPIVLAVL